MMRCMDTYRDVVFLRGRERGWLHQHHVEGVFCIFFLLMVTVKEEWFASCFSRAHDTHLHSFYFEFWINETGLV